MERTHVEEVAGLLSPAGKRPVVFLVGRDEATEVALRRILAWLFYDLVRVEATSAARWSQDGEAKALLWAAPPAELPVLQSWREACPDLPAIVLIPPGSPEQIVEEALSAGADQVLSLPVEECRIAWVLRQAIGRRHAQEPQKGKEKTPAPAGWQEPARVEAMPRG